MEKKFKYMNNIVFDLGGVVVKWNPDNISKLVPNGKVFRELLIEKGFFEKYWSEFDRGTIMQHDMATKMCNILKNTYAECWDFMESIKHSLVNIPETEALIHRLKDEGYNIYCLSNMSFEFYDYMKDRDVFSYFDNQVISAHEKLIKPEPEIYSFMLDKFSIKAEDTLFIDDLEANIKAAAKFGINVVHFDDKTRAYKEIEDMLLK